MCYGMELNISFNTDVRKKFLNFFVPAGHASLKKIHKVRFDTERIRGKRKTKSIKRGGSRQEHPIVP